ncbi:MAG TPA: cellulose biosynthesis protein BcsQ [Burkholderiaceae bacterium]|nr:cellulose biosynthesis protein BcsQ [Burkholderiaceae bacterium]
MPCIAVVSPCGGSGRSTLTASLATLTARSGVWGLAVECDPQNLLALHFGAEQAPTEGLASRAARGLVWNTAALAASDGTLILPFGAMDAPALVDWERRLIVEPDWLSARLDTLARPAENWTFIDTPRAPSVLTRQAVRAANAVLLVLRADGASMALLEPALAILEDKPVLAVVNAFDPGRALQKDVLAVFYERLGERLSPYPVHRDEAMPEAFARRMSPEDHSAHAQVIHDLHGLLGWIQRQCRLMTEPRTGSNVL